MGAQAQPNFGNNSIGNDQVSALWVKAPLSTQKRATAEYRAGADFTMSTADPEGALAGDGSSSVARSGISLEDGCVVTIDELFDLFRAAGYLRGQHESSLARIIDDVRRSFATAYERRSNVFNSIVARKHGALVGHISRVRVFERTWMAQHLVSVPSRHVAHLVVQRSTDLLLEYPRSSFFKAWYQEHKSWPRRVFGEFASKEAGGRGSDLRAFRRVLVDLDAEWPIRAGDCQAVEAGEAGLRLVADALAARVPPLLVESDDLDATRLRLTDLGGAFAAIRLHRSRAVLLAMRNGECLGFALAELGSPGLNLYELLSTFRLHVLPAGEALAQRVRQALLGGVARFYRSAGRREAHGLIACDEATAYQDLGLSVDEGTWNCWTFDYDTLLGFCAHLQQLFERLDRARAGGGR
jgi:hypothetical protein